MSDKKQIAARASLIEQLMSERNFEDLGSHLSELETHHVTKEHLQGTDIVRAVYRVLKHCPAAALKKKAKCLLSEWKTLLKPPHFNPRDSLQLFPAGGHQEVNSGPARDPSPDERRGVSSSNSLLSPQNVLVPATETVVPGNSTDRTAAEEEHFQGVGTRSADGGSGESLDPTVLLRTKCTALLSEALASSAGQPTVGAWQDLAREIEEHIFALHSKNLKKYKICIRSKVANLKNPKNSHLKENLFSGTTSPREFAAMTVMDMASAELKQLRASYTDSGIQEHCLPRGVEGTPTETIRCRRCEKFNCRVTVIARGALFLPSWVRNSSPDEEMMTYVICMECGEQWYHSKWVCL